MTNQDIAGELYVSLNTVKTHIKAIYRKLGRLPGRGRHWRAARASAPSTTRAADPRCARTRWWGPQSPRRRYPPP